uniref:Uncharacterized protein n=1 Tax=Anguilla anguilla TaxID=7936 RepID=A0A0E9PEG6_ANGAN
MSSLADISTRMARHHLKLNLNNPQNKTLQTVILVKVMRI